MKKIINKKVYDTNTAELLHKWDNGRSQGDFSRYAESLYKTKSGAYFVYGEGGAESKYARHEYSSVVGGSVVGGRDITVLDVESVVDWLGWHEGEDVLVGKFASYLEEA